MLLPKFRRSAAAGAWLAVCAVAFLQPPLARAGVAFYDGWFENRIDREPPGALCAEGAVCEWSARPFAPRAYPPAWTADWEETKLYLSSAAVAESGLVPENVTESWACILDPEGFPMEGRSAGVLGVEGQKIDTDCAMPRTRLDHPPDDDLAHAGVCILLGTAFVAAARCMLLVQCRRRSCVPAVQCHDASSEIFVRYAGEAGAAHGVGELIGFGKTADRFRQIRVGVPAARYDPSDPREDAMRIEVI